MKNTVKSKLEKLNQAYCNYNQTECSDQRFMVRNNHPAAKSYVRLRAFFDKLKYCCNSNARLFSYIASGNESQVWAPKLDVSWRAGFTDTNGIKMHEVYPAMGGVWYDYLKSLANRGWKNCDARLDVCNVHILTSDQAFKDELNSLPFKGSRTERGDSTDFVYYSTSGLTVKRFYQLIRLIRKYHKGHILPKRKKEQTDNEQRILPMEKKTVMLGNSDDVIIENRQILVPLIPLNDQQQVIQSRIVTGLVNCLKEGLPWLEAEQHLQGVMTDKAFNELKARYM